MKRRSFISLSIASTLVLSSCASGYRKDGLLTGGGLKHSWTEDGVLEVRSRGNAYTSAQQTEEMKLLWAAERMQEKGFDEFHLVDENNQVVPIYSGTATSTISAGSGTIFRGNFKPGPSDEGGETIIVSNVIAKLGPKYIK